MIKMGENAAVATRRAKSLMISKDGNTYTIRGLTEDELTHLNNALTQMDISGKLDVALKGAVNGLAELDANGKVPSSQLPAYVDDVVEYSSISEFPPTGETGKIYVAIDTNKTYRWGGTEYVEISASIALGTTSSTAFRGDYGNIAYNHATDANRLTTAKSESLYKISTTAEGHIKTATPVEKSDITSLGIPESDTTYNVASRGNAGLCPGMPAGTGTTKYLREDGSWEVPPSTSPTVIIDDSSTSADKVWSAQKTSNKVTALEMLRDEILSSGYSHNGLYRGKNFGTITADNIDSFVTTHKIATGEFEDLFLGDYFLIQDGTYNKEWMIVEFDKDYGYYKNENSKINTHRIVIMPRSNGLLKSFMHNQENTTVGIGQTDLQQFLISENFMTPFRNLLGNHVLNLRVQASNNVGETDVISTLTGTTLGMILPSEMEFYGSARSSLPNAYLADDNAKHMFPVFRFINQGMNTDHSENFWIGTIGNLTGNYCKSRYGNLGASTDGALSEYWVRPIMAIG